VEWGHDWVIEVYRRRTGDWQTGHGRIRQDEAHATAAAVARRVQELRADPAVMQVKPPRRRVKLLGELPRACPNGHPWPTGRLASGHLPIGWRTCVGCHGHFYRQCTECGHEEWQPPVSVDCRTPTRLPF